MVNSLKRLSGLRAGHSQTLGGITLPARMPGCVFHVRGEDFSVDKFLAGEGIRKFVCGS
jgi:hypothetical protein